MIPVSLAIAAVILALVTAFIASMAGVGGGFLYVPLLTLVFGLGPTEAVGTSLVVIVVTTSAGLVSYLRQGRIFFGSALALIVPGMIGSVAGAYATSFVPADLIGILFALIVALLSTRLLLPGLSLVRAVEWGPFRDEVCHDRFALTTRHRMYYLHSLAWGLVAGISSGLVGIGGGVINVPALVCAGMPVHFATATSTLVVLCTSLSGAGIHAALGHVNTGFAVLFGAGAVLGGYLGARAAPAAPEPVLRIGIGILFVMAALGMGISSLR